MTTKNKTKAQLEEQVKYYQNAIKELLVSISSMRCGANFGTLGYVLNEIIKVKNNAPK